MTAFRQNTTYPFLKIARECGVPYAKVLHRVEQIESGKTFLASPPGSDPLDEIIMKAVRAEYDRRYAVREGMRAKAQTAANA